MEVFYLGHDAPKEESQVYYNTNKYLEKYVPSSEVYGFGRNYLTFPSSDYDYIGQSHNIEWTNNLKAYKCEIAESECQTDVNAGKYTKTLKATYSDGVDVTVDIPYTYTIKKAPLSLTVDKEKRMYGQSNPEFSCTMTGFVDGEGIENLTAPVEYECSANERSKVGSYPIRAVVDAPNYEVTYTYGELSVMPAALTVTVEDKSKVYGDPNPEFTMTIEGLVNNETSPAWRVRPQLTTSAVKGSPAGEYAIEVEGGECENYSIQASKPGKLVIEKRELNVKADDCTRAYGEENPAFNLSYSGFVNGDSKESINIEPTVSCSATSTSDAGTYDIVPTGGEAENYYFTYSNGSLTVLPKNIGFMSEVNNVVYNDMSVSSNEEYFQYVPELDGPFDEAEYEIKIWALDKDNQSAHHDVVIEKGEYAGGYVAYDGPTYAGKYIYDLVKTNEDVNIEVDSSRAYATVSGTSSELVWSDPSIIRIAMGSKQELDLSYLSDSLSGFDVVYDDSVIKVYSEKDDENRDHWYVEGLAEGSSQLSFRVYGQKNQFGFCNYLDSPAESRRIEVYYDESVLAKVSYCINGIGSMSAYVALGETLTVDLLGSEDWKVKQVYFNNEPVESDGVQYTTPKITSDAVISVDYEYAHEIIYDFTTGVEMPSDCPYTIRKESNHLIVGGVKGGDAVVIYTVNGMMVTSLPDVPDGMDEVSVALQEGEVYIMLINGTPVKFAF